ncbi:uncharacterized protein LY79DRAFT_535738 [Colletotrichum navitas]|uniref:Secreted protein n=1 Tax=Colletotrichum navitas TaxID=681940 RepID=A0AAD8V9U2_9PEZI|nr:uncharacterized protein LY79DRAFT_535738 [Colletotrichum navitas]KAK1599672.1 hypothetical protein LY79DRAFT_535738 [Colletotrichum navitas]
MAPPPKCRAAVSHVLLAALSTRALHEWLLPFRCQFPHHGGSKPRPLATCIPQTLLLVRHRMNWDVGVLPSREKCSLHPLPLSKTGRESTQVGCWVKFTTHGLLIKEGHQLQYGSVGCTQKFIRTLIQHDRGSATHLPP